MKKITLLLILASTFFPIGLNAQVYEYNVPKYDKKIIKGALLMKTYPFANITNRFDVSGEKFIKDNFSIHVPIGITLKDNRNIKLEGADTVYTGDLLFGAFTALGFRKYFNNTEEIKTYSDSRTLFYAEVTPKYYYYHGQGYNRVDIDGHIDSLGYWINGYTVYEHQIEVIHKTGLDFSIGAMVCVKDVFVMDFEVGGGILYSISSNGNESNYDENGLISPYFTGIVPKAKLGIGFLIN